MWCEQNIKWQKRGIDYESKNDLVMYDVILVARAFFQIKISRHPIQWALGGFMELRFDSRWRQLMIIVVIKPTTSVRIFHKPLFVVFSSPHCDDDTSSTKRTTFFTSWLKSYCARKHIELSKVLDRIEGLEFFCGWREILFTLGNGVRVKML